MVLRTHGQPIPSMIDLQIGTFGGACNVNVCANQQSSEFAPAIDSTTQALQQLTSQVADLKKDSRDLNILIRTLAFQLGLGQLRPFEE